MALVMMRVLAISHFPLMTQEVFGMHFWSCIYICICGFRRCLTSSSSNVKRNLCRAKQTRAKQKSKAKQSKAMPGKGMRTRERKTKNGKINLFPFPASFPRSDRLSTTRHRIPFGKRLPRTFCERGCATIPHIVSVESCVFL